MDYGIGFLYILFNGENVRTVEVLNNLWIADRLCLFLANLLGLCIVMNKLDHGFGIDEEDILDELRLECLTVLADELIEIQGELIDHWHSRLYYIEHVLYILQQALVPLDILEPLNDVARIINIQL